MSVTMIQETGASAGATSVSKAFTVDVALGNIIVVVGMKYSPTADDFIAADCSKASGVATIGTPAMHIQRAFNFTGTEQQIIGIWSAQVTAPGSLTMQITGGLTSSAHNIGIGEYHSDVGAIAFDAGQTNSNTGTGVDIDSGSVTTTRNGLIIGGMANNSSDNPENSTPDGAFTTIYEELNGAAALCSGAIRRITTGSVADSASWTMTHTLKSWCAAVAAFVEPAPGGGETDLSANLREASGPPSYF